MERYHIFRLGLAIIFYATYCFRPLMVNGLISHPHGNTSNSFDDGYVFYQGVQGKPGVDFPVLSHIPRTTFNCREVESGYYADLDTDCQVFHICEDGKKISFLCPNGTIFEQSELICEWWFKVNCTNSPNFYDESAEQLREDNARRKSSRRVGGGTTTSHGAVMRTEEQLSVRASQNGRSFDVGQQRTAKKIEATHRIDQNLDDPVNKQNAVKPRSRGNHQYSGSNTQNPPSFDSFDNTRHRPTTTSSAQSKVVPVDRGTISSRNNFNNNNSPSTHRNRKISSNDGAAVPLPSTTTITDSTVPNHRYNINSGSTNEKISFGTASRRKVPNLTTSSKLESGTSTDSGNDRQVTSTTNFRKQGPSNKQYFTGKFHENSGSTRQEAVSAQPLDTSSRFGSSSNFDKAQTSSGNNRQSGTTNFPSGTNSNQDSNSRFNSGYSNSGTTPQEGRQSQFNRGTTRPYQHVDKPSSTTSTPLGNSYTFNQNQQNSESNKPTGSTNFADQEPTSGNINQDLNSRFNSDSGSEEPLPTQHSSSVPSSTTELDFGIEARFKATDEKPVLLNSQNPITFKVETVPPSSSKSLEGKNPVVNQKSTVPLTRNDIVNRRLEPSDSEESQVPQETASFYKNSFNRIEQNYKPTSANPHPNHRETYEEVKEPKYYSTKILSAISSVTPQYLSTQPINNGRPFIGSQVGTTLFTTSTTISPIARASFNVGKGDYTVPVKTTESTTGTTISVPTERFNVGRTDQTIQPIALSTTTTTTIVPPLRDLSVPLRGSLNIGDGTVKVTATPQPPEASTKRIIDHATVYGKFIKKTTPSSILLGKSVFGSSTKQELLETANSFNTGTTPRSRFGAGLNSITPTTVKTTTTYKSGFFITKDESATGRSVVRPRPFELPPVEENPPTSPAYKISSASPFAVPLATQPTPLETTLPSTFDNVDSMINALAIMANREPSAETPRPGLVIPPSAGPQTLHTLAVYFANALDGIAKDEEQDDHEDEKNLSEDEVEKKRLTELLTRMTMNRYNELFSDQHGDDEESVTVATRSGGDDDDDDLEGQHSKNAVESPKVRKLAQVFTKALSSYLDDPATFRRVLEEVRPTEPPEGEDFDDELLNFSDADAKSSFPPIYPTLPSVRPTWGYLLALNTSKTVPEVRNSLNPEHENLQLADSQSFVSQFNKLQQEKSLTTTTHPPDHQLPTNNHWTASPDATKLWKKTFSFNPASINENLGTTEAPHHEIQYELRALPKLALNSTQVHGILIDFMNTTAHESDRLQRILRKLNTTEDEFLSKMKEIEENPLTRRLILLLISECADKEVETQAVPVHSLLTRTIENKAELLEVAGSGRVTQSDTGLVDGSVNEDNQDARALQLLNSLYTIASKFGK